MATTRRPKKTPPAPPPPPEPHLPPTTHVSSKDVRAKREARSKPPKPAAVASEAPAIDPSVDENPETSRGDLPVDPEVAREHEETLSALRDRQSGKDGRKTPLVLTDVDRFNLIVSPWVADAKRVTIYFSRVAPDPDELGSIDALEFQIDDYAKLVDVVRTEPEWWDGRASVYSWKAKCGGTPITRGTMRIGVSEARRREVIAERAAAEEAEEETEEIAAMGQPGSRQRYCQSCGTPNAEGGRFCQGCGVVLAAGFQPAHAPHAPVAAPAPSGGAYMRAAVIRGVAGFLCGDPMNPTFLVDPSAAGGAPQPSPAAHTPGGVYMRAAVIQGVAGFLCGDPMNPTFLVDPSAAGRPAPVAATTPAAESTQRVITLRGVRGVLVNVGGVEEFFTADDIAKQPAPAPGSAMAQAASLLTKAAEENLAYQNALRVARGEAPLPAGTIAPGAESTEPLPEGMTNLGGLVVEKDFVKNNPILAMIAANIGDLGAGAQVAMTEIKDFFKGEREEQKSAAEAELKAAAERARVMKALNDEQERAVKIKEQTFRIQIAEERAAIDKEKRDAEAASVRKLKEAGLGPSGGSGGPEGAGPVRSPVETAPQAGGGSKPSDDDIDPNLRPRQRKPRPSASAPAPAEQPEGAPAVH